MLVSTDAAIDAHAVHRPASGHGHSPYLVAHRNALVFRIRVPADLQACLGKTEYRRSIGRCYAVEAKHRAFKLATAAFEVFSFAREVIKSRELELGLTMEGEKLLTGAVSTARQAEQEKALVSQCDSDNHPGYTSPLKGRALGDLTDEEIRSIADTWLLAALKGADLFALQAAHIRHRHRSQGQPITGDLEGGQAKGGETPATADATTAANIKAIYQNDLQARRVGRMAAEADRQLTIHGVSCDPETETRRAFQQMPPIPSAPYLKTCQELLKAHVTFYDAMERNAQGDYTAHDTTIVSVIQPAQNDTPSRYTFSASVSPIYFYSLTDAGTKTTKIHSISMD